MGSEKPTFASTSPSTLTLSMHTEPRRGLVNSDSNILGGNGETDATGPVDSQRKPTNTSF